MQCSLWMPKDLSRMHTREIEVQFPSPHRPRQRGQECRGRARSAVAVARWAQRVVGGGGVFSKATFFARCRCNEAAVPRACAVARARSSIMLSFFLYHTRGSIFDGCKIVYISTLEQATTLKLRLKVKRHIHHPLTSSTQHGKVQRSRRLRGAQPCDRWVSRTYAFTEDSVGGVVWVDLLHDCGWGRPLVFNLLRRHPGEAHRPGAHCGGCARTV